MGGELRVGVEQNVPERGPGGSLDLDDAGPAGRIVCGAQFGEAVAVARAAGVDEFAVGGEFEQRAVGKIGAVRWLLLGVENDAMELLRQALGSNNPEAALGARRLAEDLIARGHFGFRAVLKP